VVTGPALLILALTGTATAAPATRTLSARCTGDTLSVQVSAGTGGTAQLLAGHDQGHLVATGDRAVVPASGKVVFDLAGLGARHYRVDVVSPAGKVLARSSAVPAASCAPGHEVPEVPAGALVPGSLLLTGGAVLLRRRRAAGA
ncbi:MAG: hypothetical protein ACXVFV_05105, partial [Mycobacteriales bacterium]